MAKKWLNADANKTRDRMIKQYGPELGTKVFYAKAMKHDDARTPTMADKANRVYQRGHKQQ